MFKITKRKRNYLRDKYSEDELESLLVNYTESGLSSIDIATIMSSSERTITRWKSKFGLSRPTVSSFSVEDAIAEYKLGLTATQIAKRHGVSVEMVCGRLKDGGIQLNRADGIRRNIKRRHNLLWSDIEYDLNSGFLKSEIIKKYKISAPSLNNLIRRQSYVRTFVGDLSDVHQVLDTVSDITNAKRRRSTTLYLNGIINYVDTFQARPTASDLARFMDLSVQTVSSWFKSNNHQSLLETRIHQSYNVRLVCTCLDNLNVEYELDDRMMIAPLEIDVWIPELRVGIEINPTTSHNMSIPRISDDGMNYHQNKSLMAMDVGIRLIHIFDWDIVDVNSFMKYLKSLLYPDVNINDNAIIVDLNKPLISEQELIKAGFTRDSVVPPVGYLMNRNSSKAVDVIDRNTVTVFDAGKVSYKRINI